MIQAEHITKTFHGFKALDDMSLHVPKGTIYGLVGPNGAGKSTLIRHLTGIYRPDCGSILIDGLPSVICHSADLLHKRVHFRFSRNVPIKTLLNVLNDLGIAHFQYKDKQIVVE